MSDYRAIPVWLIDRIAASDLVVLRHKDGTALNVSYSEDGLRWTANKWMQSLYYKNAYISNGRIRGSNLEKSPDVYVEKFVPINFSEAEAFKQRAESTWVGKGLKLAY